jgi:hypothetical protein
MELVPVAFACLSCTVIQMCVVRMGSFHSVKLKVVVYAEKKQQSRRKEGRSLFTEIFKR